MRHDEMVARPGGSECDVILVRDASGIARPCAGQLDLRRAWTDQVQIDRDGRTALHRIELYHCAQCGTGLLYDATEPWVCGQVVMLAPAPPDRSADADMARAVASFHLAETPAPAPAPEGAP